MLTDVQKAYIEKTRAVRLTFDGYADLYNFPLLGSHTAAEDRFIDENGMSSALF